jgi:beta-mannanase
VEPYPAPGDHEPLLESVLAGKMDDQLYRLSGIIRDAAPQIVLIRWGHEMDLSGLYPWSANRPDLYQAAFRHVVSIFRETHASNARFVWSPAGQPNAEAYFPGADVVDYVGLTILADAGWDAGFGLPPQSFAQLLEPRYARVQSLGKPIIVAEVGVSGSPERQSEWLSEAAQSLWQFHEIRALVYFDDRNPPVKGLATRPDWRVQPAELRQLIADADSLPQIPGIER